MIDIKSIRKLMIDADMKPKDMAELFGVSTSALNKKLNGKIAFTLRDIDTMINTFGIDNPKEIFFKQEVS